jgi:hypothetical protein
VSAFSEFSARRREKWLAGRALYGGDCFQGDPGEEFLAEAIDGANYAEEMSRRGVRLAWLLKWGCFALWLLARSLPKH